MTPGEMEEIRERSTGAQTMPAGHLHAHEDRRRLLAHADALQARLLPLLSEHSRYSTALETISTMGCEGDGAGDTCSCAPCRADEALTGSEALSEIAVREEEIVRLASERDAAWAEVERLRAIAEQVIETLDENGDVSRLGPSLLDLRVAAESALSETGGQR